MDAGDFAVAVVGALYVCALVFNALFTAPPP